VLLDALHEKGLGVALEIVAAVLQTAQGVAIGSPQAALEGLSKLAPKDSTVGVALKGLAAASKGDVGGVIDAVAKLTDDEAELADVKERLAPFQSLAKKTGVLSLTAPWATRPNYATLGKW
jgi:hypothetical protein